MSDSPVGVERVFRRGVLVGVVAGLMGWARAPFAPRNFWGEDGARFFLHALEDGWIEPMGRALAGYFHFLPRLLGPVGTLVPIEWAPAALFVCGAAAVAWFSATIYLADSLVGGRRAAFALALMPVLLPITGFESIANLANLHFLMLCATAVVLVGEQETQGRRINDTLLATVVGLTSPTTLGLIPLAAARVWLDRNEGRRLAPVVVGWIVGIGVQLLLIATLADESREMASDRSVQKIGFLFLERVVSYNLVPFWPRISGEDASTVTASLVLRALVGAACLAVIGLLLARAFVMARRREDERRAVFLIAVPATAVFFFTAASWLVGSEPRYAVFSAFCLVWALLTVTVDLSVRVLKIVLAVFLVLAVTTHWVPSDLRRTGPTWKDGIDLAVDKCRLDPDSVPVVPILPEGWSVPLSCNHLNVG